MHGTCTELYPSILRAELTAVLNVLRVAMPPVRIHVDNAEVVRGFAEGPRWCTAAGRDGGELWREVWERMRDIEGGVSVIKVKAHTDEDAVAEGIITERNRFGNLHADREAKRGARLAESLSPTGLARSELVKALRWTGWVRRFAATWSPDIGDEEEGGEGAPGVETAGGGRGPTAAGLRHLIWERGLEWRCRRCGREAATAQKRRSLQSSRCLGSAVGRMLQRTCADAGAIERCCVERQEDLAARGWRPRGGREGGEVCEVVERAFEEEGVQEGQGPTSAGEGAGLHAQGSGEEGAGAVGEEGGVVAAGGKGSGSASHAEAASAGGSGSATAGPQGQVSAQASRRGAASQHCRAEGRRQLFDQRAVAPEDTSSVAADRSDDWRRLELRGRQAQEQEVEGAELRHKKARKHGLEEYKEQEAMIGVPGECSSSSSSSSSSSNDMGQDVQDYAVGDQHVEHLSEPEDPFGHLATGLAEAPPALAASRMAQRRLAWEAGEQAARARQQMEQLEQGRNARRQPPTAGHAEEGGKRRRTSQRSAEAGAATASQEASSGHKRAGRQGGQEERTKRRRQGELGDEHGREPEGQGDAAGGQGEVNRPLPAVAGKGEGGKAVGRRYTGVVADPVDALDARGHSLRITGPMIWCSRCGRYALQRVGRSLKSACKGEAVGAYLTRLARLREGRHPLKNTPLIGA